MPIVILIVIIALAVWAVGFVAVSSVVWGAGLAVTHLIYRSGVKNLIRQAQASPYSRGLVTITMISDGLSADIVSEKLKRWVERDNPIHKALGAGLIVSVVVFFLTISVLLDTMSEFDVDPTVGMIAVIVCSAAMFGVWVRYQSTEVLHAEMGVALEPTVNTIRKSIDAELPKLSKLVAENMLLANKLQVGYNFPWREEVVAKLKDSVDALPKHPNDVAEVIQQVIAAATNHNAELKRLQEDGEKLVSSYLMRSLALAVEGNFTDWNLSREDFHKRWKVHVARVLAYSCSATTLFLGSGPTRRKS